MSVLAQRTESLQRLGTTALPLQKPRDSSAGQRLLLEFGFLAAVLLTLLAEAPPGRAVLASAPVYGICLATRHLTAQRLPWAVGPTMRGLLSAALAALAISIGSALIPELYVRPWGLLTIAGAAFAASVLSELRPRPRRVLLVGGGDGSDDLLAAASRDRAQLEVVAIVGEVDETSDRGGEIQLYPSVHDLHCAIATHQPDLVIVNVRTGRLDVFQALLDRAGSGFRVLGLPEVYEHAFGRVPVADVSPAWFMSLLHLYQRPYVGLVKRSFDVIVASIALLVALPLCAVIAVLVGRPILYRQVRLGEWGRNFAMYKFRTMCEEAEEAGEALYAAIDDPRVTRIGRFLRKTRLDELPQLWNVLIGDMSIVGPRPERPEFCSLLERVPWWMRRNMVKPGITGWAQVNSGYAYDPDSAAVKLSYDLWYLRHRSLLIDLVICLKTLPRLVAGAGAR